MTPSPDPGRSAGRWLPLVGAVVFAVAHTQPPHVYSNQNQYYLHGLAAAGYGDLRSDWLANTRDPTPVFSAFVEASYRMAGIWPLHAAFFALLVVYFLSLWGVASALPFAPRALAGRTVLAAGLIVVHAAVVRAASVWLVGVDYPWYLQAGVANQYLVGPGLQPSVFGVFLLAALAAFAHGRPTLAGGLCAAACALHSTYLLPAGLLVGGMLLQLWLAGRPAAAVRAGAVALVGVLPVLAYVLIEFAPTSAGEFAEAQRVLAWVRIPHHTLVSRWLDVVAGLQIAWAVGGVAAARRSVLFVPLAFAAVGGLALSLVQVMTGDATLALLFPWRVSAVLVPVATAAAAAGLGRFADGLGRPAVGAAGLLMAAVVAGAAVVFADRLAYQESPAEARLLQQVAAFRRPGDLYLLPAAFPKPPTARGSASATFVPVKPSAEPAIFELQRFRLGTGAAAYVDFKSIPYRDAEVLEWKRRIERCEEWYATPDWDAGVADAVAAEGVTHVVVPAGRQVRSRWLEPVYSDPAYAVYRLAPGG